MQPNDLNEKAENPYALPSLSTSLAKQKKDNIEKTTVM